MATSKLLITPKIIEIVGSTIRIAHPSIKSNISSSLAAAIAISGTAGSVYDNNGFSNSDYFILGAPGDRETEEGSINGAVTRGQSITFTNTLKFAHGIETPITKIFERGIKIYGAATIGGAGTLIASVDAITTPIADAVMIQWDKPYTEYTLITTDTTYAYYYAKFTDGTTDSSASTYVPSTGLSNSKLEPLIKQALDITNSRIDEKRLTRDMFVNWANDCQDAIKQFVYQDPGSGRWLQKDWSFEIVVDETIAFEQGQDSYALSGLGYEIKYPNSDKSIFSVQIGDKRPMGKMAIKDWDILRRGVNKTLMNGTGAVGATSFNVDSTANYQSSGSLTIGSQAITYTGKTATSFTGVPASGIGSITTLIADNTPVWQNIQQGQPVAWVIFNGNIIFDRPPSSDFAGKTLKIRYLKNLSRLVSVSDGTEVPFTNVFTYYLAGMAFYRLGQSSEGEKWMGDFKKQVVANAIADYIPILDEWHYYNYSDDVYGTTSLNTDQQSYYNY